MMPPANASPSAVTNQPRIGLVLGGGAARGLGHVVILEVLDELGLKPSVIAGTSIGALIGSAYAAGLSAERIRAHLIDTLTNRFDLIRQLYTARSEPGRHLLNVLPMRSALLNPEALLDLVIPPEVPQTIEELKIPFHAIATDMEAHEVVIFDRGNLRKCVAASIAIPVLFSPVSIDGRILADGGLVNPLPLDVVADEVDILIGIDVSGGGAGETVGPHPSVPTMLVHSIAIFQKAIIEGHLKSTRPDIYLDLDVGRFWGLEFHNVREILEAAESKRDVFRRQLTRILGASQTSSE